MAKYKIIFDRKECIGALTCNVIAPSLWILAQDGKVDLKGGKLNEKTGKYEVVVEINDKDAEKIEEMFNSEKHCPVVAIKIEKL